MIQLFKNGARGSSGRPIGHATYSDSNGNESNEDSLLLLSADSYYGNVTLACICDGLGGMGSGEIASGYVAEELSVWFYKELPQVLIHGRGRKTIYNAIYKKLYMIHNRLKEYSGHIDTTPCTTCTVLFFYGRYCHLFQIGDSSAFFFNNRLKKLTIDNNISRNQLSSCIGIGAFAVSLYKCLPRRRGYYLLCSDGIGEYMDETRVLNMLRGDDDSFPKDNMLRTIAKHCAGNGSKDNMSCILLKFE